MSGWFGVVGGKKEEGTAVASAERGAGRLNCNLPEGGRGRKEGRKERMKRGNVQKRREGKRGKKKRREERKAKMNKSGMGEGKALGCMTDLGRGRGGEAISYLHS